MKLTGSWVFDKVSYDKDLFENTVLQVLEILKKNKMLIPEIINIDSLKIRGKTYIAENKIMEDIFRFDFEYRNPGINIYIHNYSDIWLPMVFDKETYTFQWNLEHYSLNYYRLPKVLNEIKNLLDWDYDCSCEIDYTGVGCNEIGYDLFLSEDVISREYKDNPNPDFDLVDYLQKMKDAKNKIKYR